MEKEIKTVQTTRGTLEYFRNWDNEGSVDMINPQTIRRYIEITNEHPNTDDYDCFFAFGTEQFERGYNNLVAKGKIKDGDKLAGTSYGLYGKREKIMDYLGFYDRSLSRIKDECDPQEVYFYEYNNHECMLSWDGDEEAINKVIGHFGLDVARTITRI